jgi:hypothetical protein
MPERLPPITSHPSKAPRTLRQAAEDGMVVELRCNLCRRRVTYLAHDLLRVCSPDHPVHVPPFPCGRCRTTEYVSTRCRIPLLEEYGKLAIRRPLRQVWKWGRSYLGD